jgi:hypothetical protein
MDDNVDNVLWHWPEGIRVKFLLHVLPIAPARGALPYQRKRTQCIRAVQCFVSTAPAS